MGDQPNATTAKGSSTPVGERSHRWHWFTGRSHQVLDDLTGVLTASMSDTARGETIAEAVRLQDRLAAMIATLVADDPTAVTQARERTNITAGTARRLTKRADALAAHPAVHQALAAGEVHLDQAEVITRVVDKLPTEVADRATEAVEHLLELAVDHDAKTLQQMAKHLLHVIAPDQADELLAQQLAKEEADARRTGFLKTWKDGHGSTHGKFKIPDLHGHLLDTFLAAITNPQRTDPLDRTHLDTPDLRGRAFCELLERIDPQRLPHSGGSPVSVLVTMTLDTLTGGLQAAGILGTDLQLSPGEARRLAAKHGVIPLVLGGRSQPLDVGRRRRFFTRAQRVAMALRQDGLCNITGCDIPATWCDANHRTDWATGGHTNLNDAELICPRHHTQHHQGRNLPRRT